MDRTQLFSEWTAQENVLVLSIIILAFMIGFLGAWWVNRSKIKASDLALAQKSAMLAAARPAQSGLNPTPIRTRSDKCRVPATGIGQTAAGK
jgi:hypothetical protein